MSLPRQQQLAKADIVRLYLLATVLSSFFLMRPLDVGAAEREIRMDVAELRSGAVPRVHIAASPDMRSAGFYARTANGMVHPIFCAYRLTGHETGPVLQLPADQEHVIPIGGTPGLFVASRTGLKRDREAIIVALDDDTPAGPGVIPLPTAPAVSADVFFRQAVGRRIGALHLLPYEVAAAGHVPEIVPRKEAVELSLTFEGIAVDAVLKIADILAVEGDGPLMPIVISLPETGDSIGFKYWSRMPGSDFRDRLRKVVEGVGLSEAGIVDHASGTHFTVTGLKR